MTPGTASPATMDSVDALTADGGIIRIRPVHCDDLEALRAPYERASANSLRMRFFGVPGVTVIAAEVDRLCRPSSALHGAAVAQLAGAVVGVASYERPDAADPRAEDLNPVVAWPGGVLAVDAKLRLEPVGAEPDPVLRCLSQPGPTQEGLR